MTSTRTTFWQGISIASRHGRWALGHDRFDVLRCASLNPIRHYRLPVGTLKVGEPMDAVLFSDLRQFRPLATYVAGSKVAEAGCCLVEGSASRSLNRFHAHAIDAESLCVHAEGVERVRVIEAMDGDWSPAH